MILIQAMHLLSIKHFLLKFPGFPLLKHRRAMHSQNLRSKQLPVLWQRLDFLALAITKVWDFIHIEPDSRKIEFLVEFLKLILPVVACVWVEEIWKIDIARSDLSYEIFAVFGFYKNILLKSFLASLIISNCNTGIDNRYIIKPFFLEPIMHFLKGK